MRILIQNLFFNNQGGTETISIATYNLLKKMGHDVFFFSADRPTFQDENYKYKHFFYKDIYTFKGYLKNPIKYYWNWEAAQKFERLIKEINPEIIHLNYIISPELLFVCKKYKIRTIITFHMLPQSCPAVDFLYKNKTICKNFKCKNGNYWHCILNKCAKNSLERSIRKSLLSYIFDKTNAYSNIEYFICPSNALRDYVRQTNICSDKNRIITINNFLSDNELKTIPNYNNKGYFLYIGRLSKEKGVHYLLQAMKDLPRKIELHVVGTGQEEANLKKFAKDNNLYNVKFLGFKNRGEIKEEYQNCISTILPCNWFENFPTTNMESFINGKPVIASNLGGIPEQVEHDLTGLLFEPENVEQLRQHILFYWNNPELVIEHGRNCHNKAITQYTEERYYNELIEVYKKLKYSQKEINEY